MKLSTDKRTLPGRKQVFRQVRDRVVARDMIGRHGEALPGTPLLTQVMRRGARLLPAEPLALIQERCRSEIATLPAALRTLTPAAHPFTADISPALSAFEQSVASEIAKRK